jgi:hypothetical protein
MKLKKHKNVVCKLVSTEGCFEGEYRGLSAHWKILGGIFYVKAIFLFSSIT